MQPITATDKANNRTRNGCSDGVPLAHAWTAWVSRLVVALLLLGPVHGLRAQEDSEGERPRIVEVIFAAEFDEQDDPVERKTKFSPTDAIQLRVDLDTRATSGELSCGLFLGKEELATVMVDLEQVKQSRGKGNAYGLFQFSRTEGEWPPSADYRAEIRLDGLALGTYPFSVEAAKEPRKLSEAMPAPAADAHTETHAASRARETKEIVQALLQGTAYVEGEDENGKVWSGTAWVLDKERRLLITNDHVANAGAHDSSLGNVKELNLFFPDYKEGRVIHDKAHYGRHVDPIPATVIYGDARSDLALIQADRLPAGNILELPLARTSPELGDPLHSLGGIPAGSEGLWIYTTGVVRAVYNRRLATGKLARTVEADMETNKGNSGGPVINSAGELVAVVEGHAGGDVRSVSLYIDIEEVQKFVDEALPLIDPETVAEFVKRGQLHFESGRYDQAHKDFTRALRMEPDNANVLARRGWVYYEQDDLQTALAEFNEALDNDRSELEAYRGRAMVRFSEDKYTEAIEDLTHAIRNSTDDAQLSKLYNHRGVAYSRLGETNPALEDFDRAIDADPSHDWPHANRGNMLIDLGEYDEAISALEKAIELDSTEADFFAWVARAFHQQKDHERAIRFYELAAERNSSDPEFLIDRGRCLLAVERFSDAEQSLVAAINIDPESAWIRNEVGSVLYDAGIYDLAYAQFAKATEFNEDDLAYWYNRGIAAIKYHDFETALNDLERAAKLGEDGDVYAKRGNVYSLMGRTSDAQRDFRKARKLIPDYRRYKTKYIRIVNRTGEPIKVWVQYYTAGTDGRKRWYPTDGSALWAEWVPGEASGLMDGKQQIHGEKFHVWAVGQNSGKTYGRFQERDLIAVGDAGYLTLNDGAENEVYVFQAEKEE